MPASNIHLSECYDRAHTHEGLTRQLNDPAPIACCHGRMRRALLWHGSRVQEASRILAHGVHGD
jgi:hypothetical protein